jgi:alpha-amylase
LTNEFARLRPRDFVISLSAPSTINDPPLTIPAALLAVIRCRNKDRRDRTERVNAMTGIRLILALHNHQPVGNFDHVFEDAYQTAYAPFLDVLETYPEIPFVLHTSGPLMEWLVERRPEYLDRLRAMVHAGRVEILGGGFYEPIMTMIPKRDRVGQIRSYSAYLEKLFGKTIRGMWMPERVWEQHLVSSVAEAGIEYTVLDDFHFRGTGLRDTDLLGYYLTEDDGKLIKVFPGSERLRYLIPFHEPHATYELLRRLADSHPGSTVVFADDGEKFGSWPDTQDHVYKHGWLRRFCDMIVGNSDWLMPTTFARAVDETVPLGKVFLADSSYREMTEWVLPAARLSAYEDAVKNSHGDSRMDSLRPHLEAGGFWRNFKIKYAESDEMYARMLGISARLADTLSGTNSRALERARISLYRGQCNCPYWHGSFGGLYLPHLRNAIYQNLIEAHNALDEAEGLSGPRARLEVGDFNLDARQEARLENDRLIAFARPAIGGHLYELDVRHARANCLATLDRRPEAYHRAIAAAAGSIHPAADANSTERVIFKQAGLDQRLIYDRDPRKALVDHFYSVETRLADLVSGVPTERGDFVRGAYLSRAQRTNGAVTLVMERPGRADVHSIRVKKTLTLEPDSPTLAISYALDDLPLGVPLHFAVEINVAGIAGHAEDRYFSSTAGERLGLLDERLDLTAIDGLNITDEWLDLAIELRWSVPAGLWSFPIETVSQSEGGYEGVYQSSSIQPHWIVTADESRRWEMRIAWTLDRFRSVEEPRSGARRGQAASLHV